MRRSGKSCFLWQCLADLLAAGEPRESLVYLNLEDDRLAGMEASDLSFLRIGRAHTGHALETAVFIELLRRGCEVHYLRTPQGNEVDFHAIDPNGQVLLVQVCATAADPATLARETRSLTEAHAVHPSASLLLIVLDPLPPGTQVPAPTQVLPAIRWFLKEPN
jgi:predicted AAA+ superfamily ATPase